MELTRLLALAVFLAQGLSTPVAVPGAREDGLARPHRREDVAEEQEEVAVAEPTGDLTLGPTPPVRACTTTIYETGVNPCSSLDGVETMYPSTTTQYTQVDCHGCFLVRVVKDIYYCPMAVISSRLTVDTASTTWETICAPSIGLGPRALPAPTATDLHGPGPIISAPTPDPVATAPVTAIPTAEPVLELARKARGDADHLHGRQDAEACPTTFVVQPDKTAGSVSTEYQEWTTSTVELDCAGCELTLSTALAGYGPAGRLTETVTMPVGTTTVYSCQ